MEEGAEINVRQKKMGVDGKPGRIVKRNSSYKPQEYIPPGSSERSVSLTAKAAAVAAGLGVLAGVAKSIDNIHGAEAAGGDEHVAQAIQPEKTKESKQEPKVEAIEATNDQYFDQIFHDLTPEQRMLAQSEVQKYKDRILAKDNYHEEHLAIPQEYKEIIEQTAHAYGISVDTLMGLIGTENGGGPDKINSASKARGVAQFMEATAKQYDLITKEGKDNRGDPVLSIDAAGQYLRDTKALFGGDEGMALWSYHAGPGNVYHALRIYFYDVNHENIDDYGAAISNDNAEARVRIEKRTKELIAQDKLDISKLLSNPKVKEFTATLKDYSETYPATVVAMSQIIKEHENSPPVHDLGNGLKVSISDKPGSNLFSR